MAALKQDRLLSGVNMKRSMQFAAKVKVCTSRVKDGSARALVGPFCPLVPDIVFLFSKFSFPVIILSLLLVPWFCCFCRRILVREFFLCSPRIFLSLPFLFHFSSSFDLCVLAFHFLPSLVTYCALFLFGLFLSRVGGFCIARSCCFRHAAAFR